MLSHDEYAGELEIRGQVYSSCCPIFLYQLQNGILQCYIKYSDEQFPNIEPLRILYHPDKPNQPGHYDILVISMVLIQQNQCLTEILSRKTP